MAIKIEKGITQQRKSGNPLSAELRETLRQMNVGDSFLMPVGIGREVTYRAAMLIQVTHPGLKVSTSAEGKQIRVWRVA
jgi:hypothetical protein